MAKNFKGGYKIVSLKGLDLTGEALKLVGLYSALLVSYDKPILLSDIVIDGEAKKNALVQVEVTDDGIKINDVYGYDILVEEDNDIVVTANPQELPDVAGASAGQVLKLDANKKPEWGNVPEELPSTASASQGNALLLDAEKKPVWGELKKLYCHPIELKSEDASTTKFRLTCLIFNDSPTAFTLASFKTWLDNLFKNVNPNAKIMMSGGYNDGTKVIIASALGYATPNTYFITGLETAGNVYFVTGSIDTLIPAGTELVDGVNQLV